jgi:hypothetical protein
MVSLPEFGANSDRSLAPTLKIHATNSLLDMRTRINVGVGFCAIDRIPLKSGFIVLGRVNIHIWIDHGSTAKQRGGYQASTHKPCIGLLQ